MQVSDRTLNGKQLLYASLGLATILMIGVLVVSQASGESDRFPPATPDSPIYAAYALAMADGHAYAFNEGDPSTTGSTSHLYPALLALFLKLGIQGWTIYLTMACLNAAAFIAVIWLSWVVARELVPRYAWAAMLLVLLSPQLIYTVASQSDMGIFILLAFAAFASCLKQRSQLLAVVLLLLPWARPEGVILCAVFVFLAAAQRVWPRLGQGQKFSSLSVTAAVIGILSMLAWNIQLTGLIGFDSTHLRSFFASEHFGVACMLTVQTFVDIIREVFFGLTSNFRHFYFLPVLFGLTLLIGVRLRRIHERQSAWLEYWWLLSMVGVIGLVSMSGRAMSNMDRYLAWMLPVCIVFVARGLERLEGRDRQRVVLPRVLCGAMVAYSLYGLFGVMTFHSQRIASTVRAASPEPDMTQQLSDLGHVGGLGGVLLKYDHPTVRFDNLSGITSPWYRDQIWLVSAFEKLKHEPDRRFPAWLIQNKDPLPQAMPHFLGEQLVGGDETPDSLNLYEANWSRFSATSLLPLDQGIREQLDGRELVAMCDVGYLEHESLYGFSELSSDHDVPSLVPFLQSGFVGSTIVVEVGRLVFAGAKVTIPVDPSKELLFVLRTNTRGATVASTAKGRELFPFEYPETITLQIDLADQGEPIDVKLKTEPGHMSEILFSIPADRLRSEMTEVTVVGGHAALAYWFYQ